MSSLGGVDLGRDAFLGVEHAVLFETDPEQAREIARGHLATYLAGGYNVAKFRRLGYSEADLARGGGARRSGRPCSCPAPASPSCA